MSEALWTTIYPVMRCEDVRSRQEIYRRMNDPNHPKHLVWKEREDGNGRLILASSMTFDGQRRLREERLRRTIEATPEAQSGQGTFFPELDHDKAAVAG